MNYPRRAALITGLLFIITYITSITALFLYLPVVDEPGSIGVAGNADAVRLAAFLELLLIVANIGTALALFPILRRLSESLALGFVAARTMESVFIGAGILAMLAVVSTASQAAGADAGSVGTLQSTLVAFHQWTFLLGPGFTVGIGNGLVLGYLMYRTGLVPRPMAMLGLLGGALIVISGAAVVFGVIDQGGTWHNAAVGPEFLWELALGLWLIFKGFRPSAITARDSQPVSSGQGFSATPAVAVR